MFLSDTDGNLLPPRVRRSVIPFRACFPLSAPPHNYRRLELVATKHSWGIITRKLQTTPAIKCAKIECNKSFDVQPELALLCHPTHLRNRYLEPVPPAGPSSRLESRSGTNSKKPLWVTSTTTACSPSKLESIDTSFTVIENTWQL
ncbi:hypothetical protein Bbelb_357650 [Branchiostoma belcheri]|nr:hypothetical protein Bbelb_357650 [Branchiostoma belcheri]